MEFSEQKDRIIVALDTPNVRLAITLAEDLGAEVGAFKQGLEAFHAMRRRLLGGKELGGLAEQDAIEALRLYRRLHNLIGVQEFTDAKLDDIPNTVGAAAREISALGVRMFNVHASAGIAAMKEVVANKGSALAIAVTVLTSITDAECLADHGRTCREQVVKYATDAVVAGMDGIVCSAKELELIKSTAGLDKLITIVPGIRPAWAAAGDQKRVMTPAEAVRAGADYLVIGRPITAPPREIHTAVNAERRIVAELESA